jgi:Pyruvate/2-oxoacid:ferredoxin oxidoreductase gamma subunit
MFFPSILTTIAAFFAATALAFPIESLEIRQSATNCGGKSYTAAQVRLAFDAGYNDYEAGMSLTFPSSGM